MKTVEAVKAFELINSAKLTKLSGENKMIIIKAIKELKPIANSFKDFSNDAREKLKDDKFDEMQSRLYQWQRDGENNSFSTEERLEINNYFLKYTSDVEKCLEDEGSKEVTFTYSRLDSEEFGRFLESNDFNVEQCTLLESFLC